MQHEILLRPHEEAYIKEHKLDLKRFHGMDLVFEARMRFLEMSRPPDERAKLCPGWLEESVAALSGYAGRPTVSWPSIKRRKSDCIRIVTGDTLKSQALAGRFYPAVIRVPSLHIADHRSKKRHYGPQLFRGLKERCRRRRPLLFLKHQLYLCRCLSLNFLGNEYSFKLRLAGDVQIHDATGKPCIQLFEPILSYAVIFQCPTRPAIEDAPAGGASSVASARGAFVFFLGLAGREVAVQRAPQSEYLGGLAMKQLTIVLLTYLPSAADSSADPVMGRMSKNHCAYGLRNGGRLEWVLVKSSVYMGNGWLSYAVMPMICGRGPRLQPKDQNSECGSRVLFDAQGIDSCDGKTQRLLEDVDSSPVEEQILVPREVMSDLEAVQDVLNSALKGRLQRTGDVSFFSTASASPQVRSILEAAGGAN
ncbi:hypothetical protein AK812_SmicGene34584 [Symbiodinium microadriaticum]|uniref:Uncharacterized protein n=1 Tax=Symbiodinium microadriaticum TaxID=2951 RepID=A0A1Q9CNM4_SYMMI|nr:hypothetical protein AK812_SmicGene34584 [Symbiodinium microadriaticum]